MELVWQDYLIRAMMERVMKHTEAIHDYGCRLPNVDEPSSRQSKNKAHQNPHRLAPRCLLPYPQSTSANSLWRLRISTNVSETVLY